MARLNEPPVPTETLETLRKKLLRQNRELAKSNNIRALRIRELENECACMLSENLELRGRILELEKEVEDNDARRIADHALAIKAKLESQLTEWGTLLAGLGLEPPMKKHSPRIRRSTKSRPSFSSARPSPSQRRLRDIAKDIEELGHIAENKSYPRRSMNPEQILALRSEADSDDSIESPELGPPPMSKFIDEDPVKVDSPSYSRSIQASNEDTASKIEPPETLPSPKSVRLVERSPSPEKKKEVKPQPQETKPLNLAPSEKPVSTSAPPQPVKAGSKRKLSVRDDISTTRPQKTTNENQPPRQLAEKQSIREKAGGKTLKELANIRKEARERSNNPTNARKPLAAKSTNDDMSSPKKNSQPAILDEVAAAKADFIRSKASQERLKAKAKSTTVISIEAALSNNPVAPKVKDVTCELGTPLNEAVLLSPSSPEPVVSDDGARGATPPPADVMASRETARPSRRNRTAVSYAEPNLRDKMRRPTKELFDAVTGEGKYSRRSSQAEGLVLEPVKVKRESVDADSWKKLPPMPPSGSSTEKATDSVPDSPLAGKGSLEDLPSSTVTDRRRRQSMMKKDILGSLEDRRKGDEESTKTGLDSDSIHVSEVDVYEFTPSSPQPETLAPEEPKKRGPGRKPSRRMSAAVQSEDGPAIKERSAASRRRSMML